MIIATAGARGVLLAAAQFRWNDGKPLCGDENTVLMEIKGPRGRVTAAWPLALLRHTTQSGPSSQWLAITGRVIAEIHGLDGDSGHEPSMICRVAGKVVASESRRGAGDSYVPRGLVVAGAAASAVADATGAPLISRDRGDSVDTCFGPAWSGVG